MLLLVQLTQKGYWNTNNGKKNKFVIGQKVDDANNKDKVNAHTPKGDKNSTFFKSTKSITMKMLLLIGIIITTLGAKAQLSDNFFLDTKLQGYVFLTSEGLFFQPVDRNNNKEFITSIDSRSFLIFKYINSIFPDIIKGVGDTIIVKKYFQDSLDVRHKGRNRDTIYYFKSEIDIQMNFFDTSRTQISKIGYGFIYRNNFIQYGNFIIDNYLYSVIPIEKKVLKQLYNSGLKSRYLIPSWLQRAYNSKFNIKQR